MNIQEIEQSRVMDENPLLRFVSTEHLNEATPGEFNTLVHFFERIKSRHFIVHTDMDHTFLEKGSLQDKYKGTFDPFLYCDEEGVSQELENIDLLCITALLGADIDIQTGKDANAWPVAAYMRERLFVLAQRFGMCDASGNPMPDYQFASGRLKTLDKQKHVFMIFTTGNGTFSVDLLGPLTGCPHEDNGERPWPPESLIVYKPLSLRAWEWFQQHEDLLRVSTKPERIVQIGSLEDLHLPESFLQNPDNALLIKKLRVKQKKIYLSDDEDNFVYSRRIPPRIPYDPDQDPYVVARRRGETIPVTDQSHIPKKDEKIIFEYQLQREVAPQLTKIEQIHRSMLQASIRDFALFTSWSNKINLVMNIDEISGKNGDTVLHDRWLKETGIDITDEESFFEAFRVLSSGGDFEFFRSFAQGTVFIDIAARDMDKKEGGRQIKNTAYAMNRIAAREIHDLPPDSIPDIPKKYTIYLGDCPDPHTNDFRPLHGSGGAAVPKNHEYQKSENGWPVDLMKVFNMDKQIASTNRILRVMLYALTGIENNGVEKVDTLLYDLYTERIQAYNQWTLQRPNHRAFMRE